MWWWRDELIKCRGCCGRNLLENRFDVIVPAFWRHNVSFGFERASFDGSWLNDDYSL